MSLDGLQLNQYRLLHLIGTGGMGEVYLAEDSRIPRQVAIKVIRGNGEPYLRNAATDDINHLFLHEAQAIAALQHPYILPLFDYGNAVMGESTLSYMVMPYCQEGSLEDWCQSGERAHILSFQQIAHILEQAADALQYAHERQIVHQDVKLSNLLIHRWRTPGMPDLLLADFGIAKFLSVHSDTSHAIRGTPTSMAPEQWERHPVAATDQYALAVMVYRLLTGSPPFQGGPGQIMYQHMMVQPLPPSTRRPEIPASVDAVILRALMKKPQDRFETAREFAQAFQQSLTSIFKQKDGGKDIRQNNLAVNLALGSEEETIPSPHHGEKTPQKASETIEAMKATPLITPVKATRAGALPTFSRKGGNKQMNSQRQRFFNGKGLLVVLLVLILIAGSGGLAFYLARSPFSLGITPTPSVTHSNTPTAGPSPTPPTFPANPGTLALDDPLAGNTRGYSWEEGTRDQGTCTFTNGAYHANIPLPGYFHSCLALSTHFSNFSFEVQMILVSGTAGGIVFNADRVTTHLYYFTVDHNGGYLLKAYYDNTGDASVLAQGSGVSFNGTGQIGVVEQGTTISLYVNGHLVQQVNSKLMPAGQLGVVTYEGEAVFSNARAWAL